MGKIFGLIALYKLFLSEIKINIFDKFLAFFDGFFGCALCRPSIDTLSFQSMKGVKIVNIPGKF